MGNARAPTTDKYTFRFCIWTLRHQTQIAGQIRIFTWAGALLILFLALAGCIRLDTALHALVISLLSLGLLLWMLIMARRNALLNIRDPELREIVHLAMLQFIYRRRLSVREKAWLRKKLGRRYCELGHC